tara:strand:- start:874 stop:1311 length:438 start_codon:yes stop_codon:yes gene_type:complete
MQTFEGNCLCGKNAFRIAVSEEKFSTCHCGLCRQQTGGPLMMIDGFEQPDFEHPAHLTTYHSSEWGERQFCPTCGTILFCRERHKDEGAFCAVNVFALNEQARFSMKHQIFIDDKPDSYALAGDIPSLTGAEVFASFGKKENNDA